MKAEKQRFWSTDPFHPLKRLSYKWCRVVCDSKHDHEEGESRRTSEDVREKNSVTRIK